MRTKPFKGIAHNEVAILHTIDACGRRGERASTTWLSGHLKMNKSSVSQTLSAMEEKGWILRSLDPDNRRQTIIELTDEGRKMVAEIYRSMLISISRVLERMGPDNAERFVDMIELFLASVKVEFQRNEKSESH
jgi:DNA-binding MarR family transcriptional regulator